MELIPFHVTVKVLNTLQLQVLKVFGFL
uniref:Uncharacterized protein n=1 Tax=Arundo donax TaxID=35708 RepID=A0A0A8Y1X8_ARUDO